MYKELVERLRNCATQAAPCKVCDMIEDRSCSDTLMKQAADAIEELSNAGSAYGRGWTLGYDSGRAESKPRWISVAERLPEKYTPVLVCYRSYNTGEPMADCNAYIDDDGDWYWYDGFPASGVRVAVPITHWMPLPEPPEEETE